MRRIRTCNKRAKRPGYARLAAQYEALLEEYMTAPPVWTPCQPWPHESMGRYRK